MIELTKKICLQIGQGWTDKLDLKTYEKLNLLYNKLGQEIN